MAGHSITRFKVELEVVVFHDSGETNADDLEDLLECDGHYLVELPDNSAEVIYAYPQAVDKIDAAELPVWQNITTEAPRNE